jgi:hypothetical protein
VALATVRQHLSGGDVEGGEQVGGAVSFVVVGHRARSSRDHGQRRLGAVEGLTLGLLVETEHRRPLGGVQVEAHDVDELGLEVRVGRHLEAADEPGFEAMGPPDSGHGVLADAVTGGHQPGGPVG